MTDDFLTEETAEIEDEVETARPEPDGLKEFMMCRSFSTLPRLLSLTTLQPQRYPHNMQECFSLALD